MDYNTTASMEKLTGTDFVELGKCEDKFARFSWSKKDSNYLDRKLKVFKKDDNKDFRLVQNLKMREADFIYFMRLTNQQVIAADIFAGKKLTPVLSSTLSKDMDEQLKLSHKVVDVVDRANKKKLCYSAAVQCGPA